MPRFRILHASDLHFSTRPFRYGLSDCLESWLAGRALRPGHTVSTHSPTVALALAAFAHRYQAAYDVVVLSGDLGATGEAGDLGVAHAFLTSPAAPGRAPWAAGPTRGTLRPLSRPVVLLPGNHDRYGPLFGVPPYAPADGTFDGIFAPFWRAGQGAQELWRKTRGGVTLVLLAADFTLRPGDLAGGGSVRFVSALPQLVSVGHYGRGRVHDGPLRALRDLTRKARQECSPCVVLWVVHFDPETAAPGLELLGRDRLVRAAAGEQVPALLCGHTHHSRLHALAGGALAAYVCGTTTQFYVDPPDTNALHVLQIDAAADGAGPPTIACRRYAYDAVRKGFFHDPRFP